MNNNAEDEITDKRLCHRFHPRGRVFAHIGSPSSIIGEVIDISIHGLAFHYLSAKETNLKAQGILNILSADRSFYIQDFPYKLITDFLTEPEYATCSIESNRCSVSFQGLTERQEGELKQIISSYCILPTFMIEVNKGAQ